MSTTPENRVVPLRRSHLPVLADRLSVPAYDARALRAGVVHIGVGRFHRAHQARYFDDLAELRVSTGWGVVGASVRTATSCRGLAAQDHLFTVLEAGPVGTTARVAGALRGHLAGADALLRLLARDDLQLVTLTVTAEAYTDDAATQADSVFSLLAAALDVRRRTGRPPFTVLSCDNVADGVPNGVATRRAVVAAAYRRRPDGPALAAWIEDHGAFPASMADRITPLLDPYELAQVTAELGVLDPYAVLAEPFREWVVEDRFAGERPPLHEVGVRFVTDIGPYVRSKTRVVNGAHCAVGYLGAAAGHSTTAGAMADPAIGSFVRDLLREEVAPGVHRPDTDGYVDRAVARIANPALADPLTRLTRRGSVRIPAYVAPALVEALDAGRPARRLTTVVAGWLHHLRTVGPASEDGRAAELLPLAAQADRDPGPFLMAVSGLGGLAARPPFVAELRQSLTCLETRGVAAALERCNGSSPLSVVQVVPALPRATLHRGRPDLPPHVDEGTLDAVS